MTLPTFTLRQMVEAGVHFGHHARRWNPKMAPFIFGKKDNIHIIDLQKTYPMLYTALATARDIAAQGGKVLFVGTKRQAQDIIKENAERCGQYYVNHRWLGGMMTNWKTVYKSISRLVKLKEMAEKNAYEGYTKKEMQNLKKEQEKLELELGGIMNMGGQPDLLFVIDTPKESLAIKEAKKLGIPVIGICDTNADPEAVDFPVPGNDDAIRAISFYSELVSSAILDGMQAEIAAQGVKVEEMVDGEAKPAKKKASKKRVLIDEAWMLLPYPEAVDFLNTMARRARKRNVSLAVMSQKFQDFYEKPEVQAVLTSSDTKLFLAQDKSEIQYIKEVFKLSEGEAYFLTTCNRGEGLLKVGEDTAIISIRPTKKEFEFVETNQNKLAEMRAKKEEN